MAGESFAVRTSVTETRWALARSLTLSVSIQGRYPPLYASAIVNLNTRLVEGGYTVINLASIMIGKSRGALIKDIKSADALAQATASLRL